MTAKIKNEWFDDDAFWKANYVHLFSEEQFERAEKQTERLLQLIAPVGTEVLDLCCGPGRFAIPLAKRGFSITGVDRTQYLLTRGRARARREKARISWHKKDMREFARPNAFDLIINMWSSFGYFENRKDDFKVLQNMHTSLRPGGKVLIDNMGKEILARFENPTISTDLSDGKVLVQRISVVEDWSRAHQEWFIIDGGTATNFRFELNLYSGFEMRQMMEQAGFEDIQLYGNFKGDPYDNKARRMITVAWKPEQ